jgi:hypothetical protein
MKRIISILLLVVLTVMAIEPTLAIHFCGGSIHSVGMVKAVKTCCGGMADDDWRTVVAEPAGHCCSDYTLELSTDDFRLPATAKTVSFHDISLMPAVLHFLPFHREYEPPVLISQTVFPPGATLHASATLALICIWRI